MAMAPSRNVNPGKPKSGSQSHGLLVRKLSNSLMNFTWWMRLSMIEQVTIALERAFCPSDAFSPITTQVMRRRFRLTSNPWCLAIILQYAPLTHHHILTIQIKLVILYLQAGWPVRSVTTFCWFLFYFSDARPNSARPAANLSELSRIREIPKPNAKKYSLRPDGSPCTAPLLNSFYYFYPELSVRITPTRDPNPVPGQDISRDVHGNCDTTLDAQISVDTSTTHQSIEGFGASLTMASAWVIWRHPAREQGWGAIQLRLGIYPCTPETWERLSVGYLYRFDDSFLESSFLAGGQNYRVPKSLCPDFYRLFFGPVQSAITGYPGR